MPSSWRTLYELSHLTPADVEDAIRSGAIRPDMERADAIALRKTIPSAAPGTRKPPEAERYMALLRAFRTHGDLTDHEAAEHVVVDEPERFGNQKVEGLRADVGKIRTKGWIEYAGEVRDGRKVSRVTTAGMEDPPRTVSKPKPDNLPKLEREVLRLLELDRPLPRTVLANRFGLGEHAVQLAIERVRARYDERQRLYAAARKLDTDDTISVTPTTRAPSVEALPRYVDSPTQRLVLKWFQGLTTGLSTATDERLVNQFANDVAAAVRADDDDWLSEMRGRLEDAEAAAQQATFLLRRLIQVIDSDEARDQAMREWVQEEVIAPQLRAVN